jgi:AcrR family transcriptional regulator
MLGNRSNDADASPRGLPRCGDCGCLGSVSRLPPSSPAIALLIERGFARMTIEAVAKAAAVGKPAIYRRFSDKAGLVAHVISRQLPVLEPPDLGDSRAELWRAVEQGLDGPSYVGLIGGLIAEQDRHPELIEAFSRADPAPASRDRAINHRTRTGAR